jgi:hypothetical protein
VTLARDQPFNDRSGRYVRGGINLISISFCVFALLCLFCVFSSVWV